VLPFAKPLVTNKSVNIFIDFDGTIARDDGSDNLFLAWNVFQPLHSDLLAGKLTVAEYYQNALALLPQECTREWIETFGRGLELDTGFTRLIAWCAERSIVLGIVSDGFDAYIKPALEQEPSAMSLPVWCNSVMRTANGQWLFDAPYANSHCGCFCAGCKRDVILTNTADSTVLVYIGDGRSDVCAAEHADVVFAKGVLAAECTARGIPYHHYKTLHDVVHVLGTLERQQRFTIRRQAHLARQRAFMAE
jgi:2-hydroxy-3-keto-5-methylthiopentenyl-1-phosphate phosphatase